MDRPLVLDETDEVNWLLRGDRFVDYLSWRLDRYQEERSFEDPMWIELPSKLLRQYMDELNFESRWVKGDFSGSMGWHITFRGVPVIRG